MENFAARAACECRLAHAYLPLKSTEGHAHRDTGKRFVVHADEKLTAFVELDVAIRAAERPEDCQARAITLDNCRGLSKSSFDYVIRRFNLLSARLNKPQGLDRC
jgi:hypothetical protein